jgi:UMF1 family MFS transporter
MIGIQQIEVLAPVSESNLPAILGIIIAVQLVGIVFALLIGQHLVVGLANSLNTKRSILLSLIFYSVIAVWGFVLRSTIEFWFLAWMVAVVQGGSQALSRSLYASLSPASKSGEFFGLFSVMAKFSAFLGPLIFALTAATFGNSRPAILALIAFFILGGYLLTRVNVAEGRRIAQAEDATILGND